MTKTTITKSTMYLKIRISCISFTHFKCKTVATNSTTSKTLQRLTYPAEQMLRHQCALRFDDECIRLVRTIVDIPSQCNQQTFLLQSITTVQHITASIMCHVAEIKQALGLSALHRLCYYIYSTMQTC